MNKTYVACLKCLAVNRVPVERTDDHPNCGKCKTPLPMHGAVIDQHPEALQALLKAADRPVIVDFWAPWCGPCLSFAPTYEKAAQQQNQNYIFAKIDTEKFPQASQIYGVRGIPTLAVFDQGREVKRISGALPLPQFLQWLHGGARV